MGKRIKSKQILVKVDIPSYDKIHDWAIVEHRGLVDFIRHTVLVYIEQCSMNKNPGYGGDEYEEQNHVTKEYAKKEGGIYYAN